MSKRNEMRMEDCWNMEDVYASEEILYEDMAKVKTLFPEIGKRKGQICASCEIFEDFLTLMYEVEYLIEKIYFYANQKYHEDLGCAKYQSMAAEAQDLLTTFYEVTAFVEPEFLSTDENVILGYLEQPKLQHHKPYFQNLFRQKQHIRSEEIEAILAAAQKISQAPGEIFQIFNNADIRFPEMKDENGEITTLTHSKFGVFLESTNRTVRRNAFEKLYETYEKFGNTIAAIYIANLKKDVFYANARKYVSCREMYLSDSQIPETVYDNLIDTVSQSLPLLHRYVGLRKEFLNLDEVHMYDLYAPMVEPVTKEIPYARAKEMVLEGLEPMGEEYCTLLKEGFEHRWIDVYENEGKRSGAYSWSIFGVHPYVLLNYQPNLNHVFTLAHEMGHALHSYYSNANQPYENADYKIFVAEVASTCNESLLIHHLINKAQDAREEAYLLNHFLEQFRTTLFRQTMFAEFEKIVHEKAEQGDVLNKEELCNIYYGLNKKYFGDAIHIDSAIAMEWARIPHFYTPFYVYQYATGFSAAIALSKGILEEGMPAVERYMQFLKGGSSTDPISLLKLAGVDMGEKEPVEAAMKVFENLLDRFQSVMKEYRG